MTDVFISYSRKDKEFVQRLFQALKDQQRDIWVDWEDIPPTADWRAEIRGGMEATNAVIFVISPDSVRSKECRVELELALENNKRLVPLMYRMVTEPADQETMHPALNSHNWVLLRDEDDFNAGLQTLVKGLDTDLPYVRAHTRLFVRAREWTAENHDGSLLLRGKDLIEAESWLAGAVNKQPAPTPLHTEYIAASRRAEIRRARRLLIGVSVALVVSALLAVLAFGQWQQAATNLTLANTRGTEVAQQAATSDANAILAQNNAATADANAILAHNNEATAVYNEGLSRSVALAAQAQVDLNGLHPDRAVLLGLNALQDYPYTSQAERVLANSLRNFHLMAVLPAAGVSVAWSPDGKHIVIGNLDGSMDVYSTDPLEYRFNVLVHGGEVSGVAWSPDSTRYASVSVVGSAFIQAVNNTQNQVVIDSPESGIRGVDWSPDGTRIVTADVGHTARIWDAETGDELLLLSGHEDSVNSVSWSPDGTKIATGSSDDTAKIWDAETGDELLTLSGHDDHIYSVEWSPDGAEILTASDDKTARTWDTETGDEWHTLSGHTDYVNSAVWSPDGTEILTLSDDKTARIWDARTGEERLVLVGHNDPIWEGDWSPDGTEIVTVSSDGTFRIWDVTKPADPQTYRELVALPVASPDQTRIASAVTDGVTISDVATGETLLTFTGHDEVVNTIKWSADGQQVLTASNDYTAQVWEAATGKVLLTLTLPDTAFLDANWSPDGQYIVTQTDYDSLYNYQNQVWDAATGKPLLSFLSDGSIPIWSPNGMTFVSTWIDDTTGVSKTAVWEAESGRLLFELSDVTVLDWTPDGTRLVGDFDNLETFHPSAGIWDGQTGEVIMKASPGFGNYELSPDGTLLAGQYYDQNVDDFASVIWDTQTGEVVRTLPYVTYLAWLPDSPNLLMTTYDPDSRALTTRFYDSVDSEPRFTLTGLETNPAYAWWDADQEQLITVLFDNSVKFWDVQTGVNTRTLSGHNALVMGLNWSPDGKRIVTASADKTAKVWDAATGAELYTLAGHTATVNEAHWLADGQHILTTSDDGTIKVWRVWQTTQGLIDDAEECCAIRELTSDEQAQFGLAGGG